MAYLTPAAQFGLNILNRVSSPTSSSGAFASAQSSFNTLSRPQQSAASSGFNDWKDNVLPAGGIYYGSSASGSSPSTPQKLEYIDAPLAELYGMDSTTAYQEALSNTAMRRHMNDLKAAGLNPILGMSGSGSGGVYSANALPVDSGGSSSGGAYASTGSGKSAFDMKGTAKSLSYWLPTLVNGVTSGVVYLKTGNGMTGYGAGQVAQNIVSGLLGAIRNS